MKYFFFSIFIFFCQISLVFLTDTYVEENDPLEVIPLFNFPDISNNFFVQLKVKETTDRLVMKKIVNALALNFMKTMKRENIVFSIVCYYYYYFHGFTMRLENPEHVFKIENYNLNYVLSIQADGWVYLTNIPKITSFPFKAMNVPNNMDQVYWNTEGVKVGLVDQGIRFEEPIFVIPGKPCNLMNKEGCRVKKSVDLVREYFLGSDLNIHYSVSAVFENHGAVYGNHGTIAASLLGGSDPVSPGIAPGVFFYDYRAFNHEGRAPFSLTHLAINLLIGDDVDLIFVAFGSSGLWYDRSYASVYKADGKSEVIIVGGNGNKGMDTVPFQVSHIAQPETVVSVGSVTNPFFPYCYFTLQSLTLENQLRIEHFPLRFFDAQLKCSSFSNNYMTSKSAVVIQHNTQYFDNGQGSIHPDRFLTFVVCEDLDDCILQSLNVVIGNKPPSAIIFVSETTLDPQEFTYLTYPAGQISNSVETFKKMIQEETMVSNQLITKFAFSEERMLVPNDFTSFGPSIFTHIKPQISAIGAHVYAYTYHSGDQAYYDIFSGTSLAGSYVGAMVCVYIKLCQLNHRVVSLEMLLTRLQNTAQPYVYPTTISTLPPFSKGLAHPVSQQGAGLVNLNAMLRTEVLLAPPKLEMPFVNHRNPNAHMQIQVCKLYNHGPKEIQYVITHAPALALSFNPEKKTYELVNFSLDFELAIQGAYNIYLDHGWRMVFKVGAYSTKRLEFTFYLNRKELQVSFTFFNGYFKFTPVSQFGQTPLKLTKEGYVPLSLPYLYIYGKRSDFPVVHEKEGKEAFLTDFRIFPFLKDYLEPKPTPAHFTSYFKYKGLPSSMVTYTFQSYSKPILSMCFLFPLQQLRFLVFDYFIERGALGFISNFQNLGVHCYLFYAKLQPLRYQDDPKPLIDYRLASNQGWNGDYYYYDGATLKKKSITNGVYRICAQFERKMSTSTSTSPSTSTSMSPSTSHRDYDWCSAPFVVALNEYN